MGILNRIIASVGIGSVSVDTIIENPRICAGDEVRGYINIKGGKTPQEIENIYLYVMTKVEKESNNLKFVGKEKIQEIVIPVSRIVSFGDNIQFPFNFILHKQAPISTIKTPVWIHTGLDIKSALDPKDNDSLQVCAGPYFQIILNALERLDLVIYKVINVEDYYYSNMPFLQEIEFRPTGALKYEIDNLKLMYLLYENKLELILDVNNTSDKVDMEDKKIRLSFSFENLRNKEIYDIAQIIKNAILNFKN